MYLLCCTGHHFMSSAHHENTKFCKTEMHNKIPHISKNCDTLRLKVLQKTSFFFARLQEIPSTQKVLRIDIKHHSFFCILWNVARRQRKQICWSWFLLNTCLYSFNISGRERRQDIRREQRGRVKE